MASDTVADNSLGERVFDTVMDKLGQNEPKETFGDQAQLTRERKPRRQEGTTTVEYKGKSVTMPNSQFSKAARRIEKEGRALAERKPRRKAK